jgi:hypothetical protein
MDLPNCFSKTAVCHFITLNVMVGLFLKLKSFTDEKNQEQNEK